MNGVDRHRTVVHEAIGAVDLRLPPFWIDLDAQSRRRQPRLRDPGVLPVALLDSALRFIRSASVTYACSTFVL